MGTYFQSQVPLSYDFVSTPETVRGMAVSESSGIRSSISNLRTEANNLSTSARGIIDGVASFALRDIPAVTFDATLGSFGLAEGGTSQLPTGLYMADGLVGANLGKPPTVAFDDFERSLFSAPILSGLDFPDAPVQTTVGKPRTLAPQHVVVPPAPDDEIVVQPTPEVGDAPKFSGSFTPIQFQTIDAPALDDVAMPDLSEFDRLGTVIDSEFVRNPYVQEMLPKALSAAAALLGNNFILDMDALEQGVVQNLDRAIQQHNQRTGDMWTRRGFGENPAVAEYNDRVSARVVLEQRQSFEAAVLRWRMKLMPTVLQLNVEAHSLTTEILGELYDLDFAILEAQQAALRNLYGLAAARYNAAVAAAEIQVARYRGVVAQAEGLADRFRAKAGQQRAVGQLNAARGDAYEASQSAKEGEGDSFIAAVQMAEAVASAYSTRMRSIEAKAQAARADLLNYESSLAAWEADLTETVQHYRENRAQNRAVVARNRGVASQMTVAAADQESVAFDARASAIDTIANVAQMRAEIESRGAQYVENSLQNSIEALTYAADANRYSVDTAEFEAGLLGDSQRWDAQTRINSSVAGLYREISSNAIRAAEVTQSYRVQLANAYQGLYDTVGRAEAARLSGELSRYTASLGLQTTGSIDYSSNAFTDATASSDVSNEQANRSETRYEPGSF